MREYLLSYLSSLFVLNARQLPADALERLVSAQKRVVAFTLIADTNFVFSALDASEDDSSALVAELMAKVALVRKRVAIQISVLPDTIRELQQTAMGERDRLKRLNLPPTVMAAMADVNVSLSGLGARFASACKAAGRVLDLDSYFGPYIQNPIELLRSKGIELFNEDTSRLHEDAELLTDLEEQLQYEAKRHPRSAKGREVLLHDLTLWYFVGKKRKQFVSPIEAKYWVVTLDRRLLAFDAFKLGALDGELTFCVHPSALLNLLSLWVPRDVGFDRAVMCSFRSYVTPPFDAESRSLTEKILNLIARYEKVNDLQPEAIAAVLLSTAVRDRVRREDREEVQMEAVYKALISEGDRLKDRLARAEADRDRLHQRLEAANADLAAKDKAISALEGVLASSQRAERETSAARAEEVARTARLEQRVTEITTWQAAVMAAKDRRIARVRFVGLIVLLALVALPLIWLVLTSSYLPSGRVGGLAGFAAMLAALAATLWLAERVGGLDHRIRALPTFVWIAKCRRWLLGTVLVGVLVNVLAAVLWPPGP